MILVNAHTLRACAAGFFCLFCVTIVKYRVVLYDQAVASVERLYGPHLSEPELRAVFSTAAITYCISN